jgi:Rad3-related DNA helicase
MQAVGRLIRDDEDRGVVLLVDRRFGWQKYMEMMPDWWHPVEEAAGAADVGRSVKRFWSNFG